MANAIKKISVQRGYDVTRYALNCFGGAGGQHACLVADSLGMTKVLIHPFSSLLSAYGMGLADIRATRQQAIEEPLGDGALAAIESIGGRLGEDARREVAGQGVPERDIVVHVRAHIRYAGTDTALVVPAFNIGAARVLLERALRARLRMRGRSKPGVEAAHSQTASSRRRREAPSAKRRGGSTSAAMKSAFEAGAQSALRLHRRDEAARGRSRLGRGGRRRREVQRAGAGDDDRAPACADTHDALLFRRTLARCRGLHPRAACARPQGHGSRDRDGAAPDRRRRGRLARRDHGEEPSRARARRAAHARPRHRHPRRPDHARSVQQPVHVDRRADGRVAAEHRLFGEHQGAARFLLRGVRRRRHARRQRAAHAGASRLDGPRGRDHHPREPGARRAGRRLRDQRALQRRHASARHHGLHAGLRPRAAEHSVLGRLARPSRRCRRHLARLDVAQRDDDRGRGHPVRQLQGRRPRPLSREGTLRRA